MAILSDEEIDRLSTASTGQSSILSDADIDRMTSGDEEQVGLLKGGARALGQGLFGLGDEIEAGARTGFGFAGDYDKTVKGIRESNKAFGKQRPVLSTALEVAGALPTMWVPGMGQAGLATAIGRGAYGQIAKQSANVGMRTGAAHGFGSSDGDATTISGLMERGGNALAHGALGAGVGLGAGPAVHAVTRGVGNMARSATEAIRETGPHSHVNRALVRDGTTAQRELDDLIPAHKTAQRQQVETILVRYGESLEHQTEREARRTAVAELVQTGMAKPKAQALVRNVVGKWQARNEIPVQVHELPALREGSQGKQSNMAMRVAMNRSNEGADPFQDALVQRQLGQGERVQGLVSRALGGKDGDAMLEAARAANKTRNRSVYQAAEDADDAVRGAAGLPQPQLGAGGQLPAAVPGVQPIEITPNLIGMANSYRGRGGDVAKGMNEAIDLFFDPNTQTGVRTLRQFIDQKQRLDGLIEDSMKAPLVPGGTPQATSLTRELQAFKKDLMATVGGQNPLYAEANKVAAKGFSDIRAAQVARNLSLSSSSKVRSALKDFRSASPEAQAMMRVMFAQNITDKISSAGMTHDMAKFFRSEASRRVMSEVLGGKQADEFMRHIQRVGVGTRSHQNMGGSQTTPLAQAIKDADIGEGIKAILSHLNVMKWPEKLGEFAARKANTSRDAESLRMFGASTDRPDQMIKVLKELIQHQQQQQARQAVPPLQGLSKQLTPFAAIAPERALFGD